MSRGIYMRHYVSKQDLRWGMKRSRMLSPLSANKPTSTTHCTKAWFGQVIQNSATSTLNLARKSASSCIQHSPPPQTAFFKFMRKSTSLSEMPPESSTQQTSFILSLYASATMRTQGSASDARNSPTACQYARPPPCPPI